MNARGATSTVPRSLMRSTASTSTHVVHGVVERPQVRVDLGHEVAGQEAEALAGLDRGAGQDDAADLFGVQRPDGHGHRQPALAGTGRPDAEGDDVATDRFDVALLARRLGPNGAALGAENLRRQDLGRSLVVSDHVDGAAEHDVVDDVALLEQRDEILEEERPLGSHRRR